MKVILFTLVSNMLSPNPGNFVDLAYNYTFLDRGTFWERNRDTPFPVFIGIFFK